MSNMIARSRFFSVRVPVRPHIDMFEGGHIYVDVNDPDVSTREELIPDALIELAWMTRLAGHAMHLAMEERGIKLYRLNYQDNGNWAYLRGDLPRLHVHIYGRAETETKQQYGQALMFPDENDPYYESIEPFDEDMICRIGEKMSELIEDPFYSAFDTSHFETLLE